MTVDFALDGDSLQVTAPEPGPVIDTTEPRPIRLIGIDAPEMHGGTGGGPRCYGRDAYERLQRLAPAGSTLWLTADVQRRDPHDRYLVYAWTPRGAAFVNVELARLGYARSFDVRANQAYAARIGAAVAEAQRGRRGQWGMCVPDA